MATLPVSEQLELAASYLGVKGAPWVTLDTGYTGYMVQKYLDSLAMGIRCTLYDTALVCYREREAELAKAKPTRREPDRVAVLDMQGYLPILLIAGCSKSTMIDAPLLLAKHTTQVVYIFDEATDIPCALESANTTVYDLAVANVYLIVAASLVRPNNYNVLQIGDYDKVRIPAVEHVYYDTFTDPLAEMGISYIDYIANLLDKRLTTPTVVVQVADDAVCVSRFAKPTRDSHGGKSNTVVNITDSIGAGDVQDGEPCSGQDYLLS